MMVDVKSSFHKWSPNSVRKYSTPTSKNLADKMTIAFNSQNYATLITLKQCQALIVGWK